MVLYKLIGYDPSTDNYTNPDTGEIENLPSTPFVIGDDTVPDNYENFDGAENWASQGKNLIGSYPAFEEYLSLRYEIYTRIEVISEKDYSKWDSLSDAQRKTALVWCNVRIVNALGLVSYIVKCGSQAIATEYIANFLAQSYSARKLRYYTAFTIFGYAYLGKTQGLKAESYARKDFLDSTYIDRGVVFKEDDGISGIGDWILGLNGYTETGLKPRIISGEFRLGGGMDVDTFCNALIGILDDGAF